MALVSTLTCTGTLVLVPKLAWRDVQRRDGAGVHAAGEVVEAAVDQVQARRTSWCC